MTTHVHRRHLSPEEKKQKNLEHAFKRAFDESLTHSKKVMQLIRHAARLAFDAGDVEKLKQLLDMIPLNHRAGNAAHAIEVLIKKLSEDEE